MPKLNWYPQVGVSFNPVFTEAQLEHFARDKVEQAEWLHRCASAAFACAVESGDWELKMLNLEIVSQTTKDMVLLYRAACRDNRVDQEAIGLELNSLFWKIVGAPGRYLAIDDDYLVHWEWLQCADYLVTVLVDIAVARSANGRELEQMKLALTRLGNAAQAVAEWQMQLTREAPPATADDMRRAGRAVQMAALAYDAIEQLEIDSKCSGSTSS